MAELASFSIADILIEFMQWFNLACAWFNPRREDAKMEKQVNPPIRQIPERSGFAGSRKAPQYVLTLRRNRAATIATISAHLGFRIR